jgi:uncharacterized protein YndB with AHSA1/START domain
VRCFTILCALSSLATGSLAAEVLDSAAGGFTTRNVLEITAPVEQVYRTVIQEVGAWWDSSHTFSGDARNLRIEARPDGCFCERLPEGGGVRHLTVVHIEPGELLRMEGGLGPLQAMAVSGSLAWSFEEVQGGTRTELSYAVGGYRPPGLQEWASPVDGVLREQLERLGRYIETGNPESEQGQVDRSENR